MRNLINFLVRCSSWILFTIYLVASLWLLLGRSPYQHHLALTSANAVSVAVYGAVNNVTSYLYLRDINADLQQRNADLEMEILALKGQIEAYRLKEYADSVPVDSALQRYHFVTANVINNSISRPHNYITIHKGSLDGIRPEMGVVDQNGVVGIVNVVGPHASRVISLLNPYLRLSCKLKGQSLVGSLVWDGINPNEALLEELPSHIVCHLGDTVVTSGHSSTFPEGVPVGIVVEKKVGSSENFRTVRVALSTDFSTLSTVRVIVDELQQELKALESDSTMRHRTSMPG